MIDRTEARREAQVDGGPLVEDLREQVHYLRSVLNEEREARRRADMIIAQLTQANAALAAKVPELETSQEQPGASQNVVEEPETEPESGTGGSQTTSEGTFKEKELEHRGFWSRLFGG
jgi:hypothetical protein